VTECRFDSDRPHHASNLAKVGVEGSNPFVDKVENFPFCTCWKVQDIGLDELANREEMVREIPRGLGLTQKADLCLHPFLTAKSCHREGKAAVYPDKVRRGNGSGLSRCAELGVGPPV
jgi:hypothetical protein